MADHCHTIMDSVAHPPAPKMPPPRLNGISESSEMVPSFHHAPAIAAADATTMTTTTTTDPAIWSPTTATPPLTPCTMKDDEDDAVHQAMFDEPSAPLPAGDRKRKLSVSSHEQPSIEAKHHIVHFSEQHWFRDANDYLMKSRRRSGMPNIFEVQPIALDAMDEM
ncbi:hypothetical protein SYNPS1DRAFT_29845 [Syncephalis pseudoplumigaleata]|uniref:Uncharacterized protein n=1 Tax=Syncephalis pseudoplumigaleata TaxID=1712513 RepID=A0A4P9YWF1_9FUNG|nr:hypothetical protein SYNPS1DRAFT_29845 [Syncephalis pseudoplumigaleata]|eukprot:RKP24386.1 hypothetical protein SYNPS1DRAFT_29845 [Syncephalis pseudoplumigaleata]